MKPRIKVVFDTNIFISAIIFGGNPRRCLELARIKEIELVTSSAILLEVARKLGEKFSWNESEIGDAIESLSVFIKIVSPQKRIYKIKQDYADNRILEAALEANADYIVSGDKKHLLSIKSFKGIPIVGATQFLQFFFKKTN